MSAQPPDLIITTAPFVHLGASTPRIMGDVLLALILVMLAACWNFGIGVLLVIAAAVVGALGTEWLAFRHRRPLTLADGSAWLTGVLLGLTLPPGFPLWMAFLGGGVGVGLGKLIWGGLGQNLFNPALVGRAFLQAAFPTVITTWNAPAGTGGFFSISPSLFAAPLMQAKVDGISAATPLGLAKFQNEIVDLGSLFLGETSGSIGETSAAVLLVCGVFLAARRVFDWRLPAGTLLATAVFSGLLHLWKPELYPAPLFMLLSGGLLFGAVFMVTDPVTTPTTVKGAWIFGVGVGFLVVLIRVFGGLPEGVMYAILLMNAVTPHLNRWTQPRQFGG